MDPFDVDNNTPVVDPTKDYLSELVGEGKKYQDEKALAYAKVHSDLHISNLEKELAGLRDELKTRTSVEEFVTKLKTTEGNNSQQQANQNQPDPSTEDKRSMTPEELEALVNQTLNKRQSVAQQDANYREVVSKLQEAFGSDTTKVISAKANELGMSLETLKEMAKTTPKAFLKLVEADQPKQNTEVDFFGGPIQSTVQTTSSNLGTSLKNNAYFEGIRKADVNRYWSPEVQRELHRQVALQGDKFFT